MDAPSTGEWIGILFGLLVILLVILAIPAGAIFIERGQRLTGRMKFAAWTFGLVVFSFLFIVVMGAADAATPDEAGLVSLALLIVFGAVVFFYFRQLARRVIDAGHNKSLAYIGLIPLVNWVFVLLLLVLPSKRLSENGVSDAAEVSRNQLLYSCWCNGTDKETGEPRTSINWLFSRRAMFRVFKDRVECGDWTIPFSAIREATVYNTKQWPLTFRFLHFEMADRSFQFQFPFWGNPAKHMDLELTERSVKLQQSPITIILRVGVLGYLVFVIWNAVTAN